MKRVLSAVVLFSLAAPVPALAQFARPQPPPTAWFSAGVGAFNAGHVVDGKTGTVWDFGNRTTPQYRLSLEQALRGSVSLGLAGTFVRAPISYTSRPEALPEVPLCAPCHAEVDVYSLYAMFHAGGGTGFHQVIEAGAGVTGYQNFRLEDGGDRLPPSAERDFAFVFGYGFGYALSPRAAVNLVQEYGLNIHETRGTTSGDSNTLRFGNTRLSVRLGMGAQRPAAARPRRR
jgi:hypothetical protein